MQSQLEFFFFFFVLGGVVGKIEKTVLRLQGVLCLRLFICSIDDTYITDLVWIGSSGWSPIQTQRSPKFVLDTTSLDVLVSQPETRKEILIPTQKICFQIVFSC